MAWLPALSPYWLADPVAAVVGPPDLVGQRAVAGDAMPELLRVSQSAGKFATVFPVEVEGVDLLAIAVELDGHVARIGHHDEHAVVLRLDQDAAERVPAPARDAVGPARLNDVDDLVRHAVAVGVSGLLEVARVAGGEPEVAVVEVHRVRVAVGHIDEGLAPLVRAVAVLVSKGQDA